MDNLLLCYQKCSTCKKAQKFLEKKGVPFQVRSITDDKPSVSELSAWQEKSGLPLKRFFNTSGQLYRSLGLSAKLDAMPREEQLALLASNGMLVKRPIFLFGDTVLVGFQEARWLEAIDKG